MVNSEKKKSGIVYFETENQIGVLTIDNGNQNKINQADFLELSCLKEWLSEQNIKGLIITGQGRHFSAGADIDNIKANKENLDYLRESLKKGREILSYIDSLPIVTVAAINGVCFGAGLEIALSCQFRIATINAILAFPESNIGIMPGLAGTIRLTRKIGKSKALDMIISGRSVSAEEASEIGLIDRITAKKEHLSTALRFVNDLTKDKSTDQIKSIVQSVNSSFIETEEVAMENECELFLELVKNF
ncbi:enoyl-CoA hydratase/isomerase family protein [Wukongibacter sp. M2B1]|uniref:enoyl-CoA hydratase/isomerase family protein n=1 Tax=Wukongibacter sp. M2B1 TaxID=3088895 RepID=UPI003D7A2382